MIFKIYLYISISLLLYISAVQLLYFFEFNSYYKRLKILASTDLSINKKMEYNYILARVKYIYRVDFLFVLKFLFKEVENYEYIN